MGPALIPKQLPTLDEVKEAVAGLYSCELPVVVKAINVILFKSADVDGNGISLEAVPDLLPALCSLLDLLNPAVNCLFKQVRTRSRNREKQK